MPGNTAMLRCWTYSEYWDTGRLWYCVSTLAKNTVIFVHKRERVSALLIVFRMVVNLPLCLLQIFLNHWINKLFIKCWLFS